MRTGTCLRTGVLGLLWCCPVGIAALPAEEAPAPAAPSAEAKPRAADLVAQAIEAEVQADRDRHDELLKNARAFGVACAPAHWQSGLVRAGDRWMSVDEAQTEAAHDELLAEYREMRLKYSSDDEGELILARWCLKHGLKDELRAHASQLFYRHPDNPEVLKMLDLAWHHGQLLSGAQVADQAENDRKSKEALHLWQPRLQALRLRISDSSSGVSEAALGELHAILDPAAIEALEAFAKNRQDLTLEVVGVLGRIPGEKSTDALLRLALLSKWQDVRLAACEQLRNRPLHGYMPKLLGALSTPIEVKLEIERNADGARIRESLSRETGEVKFEKSIDHEVSSITPNPFLAGIVGAVYAESFLSTQRTAKTLQKLNHKIAEMNDAIYFVLEHTTDQKFAKIPALWWNWWRDYNVLSSTQKKAVVSNTKDEIDVPYVPPPPPVYPVAIAMNPCYHRPGSSSPTIPAPAPGPAPTGRRVLGLGQHFDLPGMFACFARGTKVWSMIGPQAIEDLEIGDRVLSQDPVTGELSYRVVLEVTLGRQPMLAIDTGDDRIVATLGHVFWVSGTGWRMAKQLEIGDRLHTVGGWVEIRKLEQLPADETHNLVVADAHTFFVGNGRILVHDYSLMSPTTAQVPGQAEK